MQEKGTLQSKDSTIHQILKVNETKQKRKMLNLTICTLKFPAITIHRGFPLCGNPKIGQITNCLHGRPILPTSMCVPESVLIPCSFTNMSLAHFCWKVYMKSLYFKFSSP